MIKFIIVIGKKIFSNYVAQSNYWITHTKLLTTLFKNNIEKKKCCKFFKTQKWSLWSKVTSAKKRWLLKMCHLSHKLRIFLFRRKNMFRFQDIETFVFLTIPWFNKSVTSWWILVPETRCIFEYIFWTTTH